MDYATKFIVLAMGSIAFFLVLTQSEALGNLLGSIVDIAESILVPIKNLLSNFI